MLTHQVTSFVFLSLLLTKYYRSYFYLLTFFFSIIFSNFWFFFVFNWSLSFFFLLLFFFCIFIYVLNAHGKKNSTTYFFLAAPFYLINLKGDHSFGSFTLFILNPDCFSLLKSTFLPLSKLLLPFILLSVFLSFPRKKHNLLLKNELLQPTVPS